MPSRSSNSAEKKKVYHCVVSGKKIPASRVKALISLGIPESRWTLVEYSLTKKIKGMWMGEYGTSELKLVDRVYDDSVRNIFEKTDVSDSSGPADNTLEDDERVCDNPLKGD